MQVVLLLRQLARSHGAALVSRWLFLCNRIGQARKGRAKEQANPVQ